MTLFAALSVSTISLLVTSAHAATIFDNFYPGDLYNGPAGYNVQGYAAHRWDYAVPVAISDEILRLETYVLPIKKRAPENWLRLEVRLDDNGLPGQTILEQIDVHDYPLDIPYVDDRPPPVVIESQSRPWVYPGMTLWITLSAPEPLPFNDNYWGTIDFAEGQLLPAFAQRDSINTNMLWGAAWSPNVAPAMRVTATPIPEPSGLILSIIGVGSGATLFGYRRRLSRTARCGR